MYFLKRGSMCCMRQELIDSNCPRNKIFHDLATSSVFISYDKQILFTGPPSVRLLSFPMLKVG